MIGASCPWGSEGDFEISNILKGLSSRAGRSSSFEGSSQEALRRFKADIFQVLAHPTRIHIIECLRDRELSVSQILETISVEPANASQHLAVLRGKGLVVNRKEGNQVYYSLRDPLLTEVLDAMRQYFKAHIEGSVAILQGLDG